MLNPSCHANEPPAAVSSMALTLETRRVSKGVRYPENKRTPWLTRRVTFLKSVPLRERVPADLPSDTQQLREMIAVLFLSDRGVLLRIALVFPCTVRLRSAHFTRSDEGYFGRRQFPNEAARGGNSQVGCVESSRRTNSSYAR